jgi:hydroxymethylpyrimidine pyrophosphatase-like HAD family hydrolase
MRFRVLACDYDRTIALKGVLTDPVRQALQQVRDSGRRMLLVTGRTLDELRDVLDDFSLFALVVEENGGAIYDPASQKERPLAPRVPDLLIEELRRRDIGPLTIGHVLCATASENEPAVVRTIADLGLELEVGLNRDSIMILPPDVDKAFGLRAALAQLGEDRRHTVAVGDGENDVALLRAAGVGVAVENAVEELKAEADIVLTAPAGDGIRMLCASLVRDDLADLLEDSASRRAG